MSTFWLTVLLQTLKSQDLYCLLLTVLNMARIRFWIWFRNRNRNFSKVRIGTGIAIISQNSYEGVGIWRDCIIKL